MSGPKRSTGTLACTRVRRSSAGEAKIGGEARNTSARDGRGARGSAAAIMPDHSSARRRRRLAAARHCAERPGGDRPFRMRLLGKKRQRLRPLTETEAYARCHGDRAEDVRIVEIERKRPRFPTTVSGERVRTMFEERLNAREAEAAAAASAAAARADTDTAGSGDEAASVEAPVADAPAVE